MSRTTVGLGALGLLLALTIWHRLEPGPDQQHCAAAQERAGYADARAAMTRPDPLFYNRDNPATDAFERDSKGEAAAQAVYEGWLDKWAGIVLASPRCFSDDEVELARSPF